MRLLRHKTGLATIIILSVIILLLICLCVIMWFKTGEEASVGIFSLAVTLLGTIFIAIELKNGQHVTCSDMLINLNNYFHDSDRLMKVYEVLERDDLDQKKCRSLWEGIKSVEVAQYCTFFENLYLLYKNEIADIEDLDDLFGYRFFIFVHNPYIQEHYILPTSSSYVQIFKLYAAWIRHRMKNGGESWQDTLPYREFMFAPEYLTQRTYMHDRLQCGRDSGHCEFTTADGCFTIKELSFENLSDIMELQRKCVEQLPDADIYYPLSRAEMLESLHLDTVLGAWAGDTLAAVAVIVSARDSERNLARETGCPPEQNLTFDAVLVLPEWRGHGLHRAFLEYTIGKAAEGGVARITATVSPENEHSLSNFLRCGFTIAATKVKYGGLTRHILTFTK